MDIKEFGKRLKSARVQKGMSQRSLGLALGLSDKTISSYESSRSFPNLEVLIRMAGILNKPVDFFISSRKDVLVQDSLQKVLNKQEELSQEIKNLKTLIKEVE